jgi:predicted dehydrogenase
VVGAGRGGEAHLRALGKVEDARVVALCDVDVAVARAAAARCPHAAGATVYADLGELLVREGVDVAIIATPNGHHADHAALAFAHGAHAIVDKPLDITLARIDTMRAAARAAGVRLAGIFQTRHRADYRAIKAALDEQRLGPLVWLGASVLWQRDAAYYAGWRGDPALAGGTMLTTAIHGVDALLWLGGPVHEVSAWSATRTHAIAVEDTLVASLRFASGALGSLAATTAASTGEPMRIEAIGARERVVLVGSHDQREDPLANNLSAIFAAWRDGRDPETSAEECRRAVEVVLSMYASAARGGVPVEIGVL